MHSLGKEKPWFCGQISRKRVFVVPSMLTIAVNDSTKSSKTTPQQQ